MKFKVGDKVMLMRPTEVTRYFGLNTETVYTVAKYNEEEIEVKLEEFMDAGYWMEHRFELAPLPVKTADGWLDF